MSALDRAYIRAYARGPAPQTSANDEPALPSADPLPISTNGAELESLYAAGTLYRLDWQTSELNRVPPRHQASEPTKRRLRFAQPPAAPPPPPSAVAPARKPPQTFRQPLNLVAARLREAEAPATPVVLELDDLSPPPPRALHEAPPVPERNAVPARASDPATLAEPLPTALPRVDLTSQVQVAVSAWKPGQISPAMVVAPLEDDKLARELAPALVSQHFDSLAVPDPTGITTPAEKPAEREYELIPPAETSAKPMTPPMEDPVFRLDAAVAGLPKPHFGRKPAPPAPEQLPEPAVAPAEDIVDAEAVVDLAPARAPEPPAAEVAAPAVPFAPLWEVDNFHWPAVCERLLAGEQSYFAQSGEKLKGAVQDGLRVLAVAATRRGDGSTTLALCLARSAAAAGLNVALVDADIARPELADCLGLEVECGWQTVAAGKAPLADAAIRSLEDRLTVFPIKADEKHKLTLADPRAGELLRNVASHFDLVLVDMGHVTGGTGPLLPPMTPAPIGAAVVVRDARSVTESSARIVGLKLHAAGIEAVGLAENFGQGNA